MSAPQQLTPGSWQGADDIVIVGAGLAGLFCALKLAPKPVTVIAAAPIGHGASSAWAQGGIAAAIGEGDTPEAHLRDTLRAGASIVDEAMARLMVEEASDRIFDLLDYGVPFDRDLAGMLVQSREAAHSAHRVVRVKGDMAGKAIMQALVAAVRTTPSIRVVEGYVADRLIAWDRFATGLEARRTVAPQTEPDRIAIRARSVVLATGGIGRLYAVTTNPTEARGEGLVMAARAGARIADTEFVQFHPTAIAVGGDPAPLATEALRGEGATLVDRSGCRFMPEIHRDAELAPRDIVARAVHKYVAKGGAFLDCTPLGPELAENFPKLMETCRTAGLDPLSEPIPVEPAAHYHMGGIVTDARGRSTVDGLWAIGEVTSTGVHGANRLASNSLLEAVVFAARTAEDILDLGPPDDVLEPLSTSADTTFRPAPSDAVAKLRRTMSDHVGVVRSADTLTHALSVFEALQAEHPGSDQLHDMITAARFITVAALSRTESRGGHYREDFPAPDPAQAERRSYGIEDVMETESTGQKQTELAG
ncbi:MAG: L-aspartate oxidase [Pseudomonadota bacterium]